MDQWTSMAQRWEEWGSPLRPSNEDVALIREQILPGKTLLLGATPELLPLASVAVDSNEGALKTHKVTKAVVGDWRKLPFPDKTFDTVIGDGSLNVFESSDHVFFDEMQRVCKRLVLRVFVSPHSRESVDWVTAIHRIDGTLRTGNFHAYKWEIAHALAKPYVAVKDIYDTIKPVWDHPTLEVYKDSKAIYYFPRLVELNGWSNIVIPSTYELAERCPIITWEF